MGARERKRHDDADLWFNAPLNIILVISRRWKDDYETERQTHAQIGRQRANEYTFINRADFH